MRRQPPSPTLFPYTTLFRSSNGIRARQSRCAIDHWFGSSVVLSDLLAVPPIGSPEAKPGPAILSRRGVGAISAGQRARWRENACCDDSRKAPLFPSSQSSGSHAKGTTQYVVRQAFTEPRAAMEIRWLEARLGSMTASAANGCSDQIRSEWSRL